MLRLRAIAWLMAATNGAPFAAAQTLLVHAVEDSTRAPVAGAIIRILSPAERVLAQGLTNERGRLTLHIVGRGHLRIRADRIGFEGIATPLDIPDRADTIAVEVVMPRRPLVLASLEVTAKNTCSPAATGNEAVVRLWNEIKKALEANQLTYDQRLVSVRAETVDRWLDTDLHPIMVETTEIRQFSGPPFATLEPEALVAGGFIREQGLGAEFFGPDAALLLADSFVLTHCFATVVDQSRTADQGQLGLRFKPVQGRTSPDIEGTLWVDRDRARLRALDFGFVHAPKRVAARSSGGTVRYSQLESGAWVVEEWFIRMPRFVTATLDPAAAESAGLVLVGYTDHGARAEVNAGGLADPVIAGVVFDSLTNTPLAGVVVSIEGDSAAARTNPAGEFALRPTITGDLTLEFAHPRLAFLPSPPRRVVSSSVGRDAQVTLAIPPAQVLNRLYCPSLKPETGAVIGIVRTTAAGGPVAPGVTVSARYEQPGTVFRFHTMTATTSSTGLFVMCGVPSRRQISVGAGEEASVRHWRYLKVPELGVVTLELEAER